MKIAFDLIPSDNPLAKFKAVMPRMEWYPGDKDAPTEGQKYALIFHDGSLYVIYGEAPWPAQVVKPR